VSPLGLHVLGDACGTASPTLTVCGGEGTGLCRQAGKCIALQAAFGKMALAWHVQLCLTGQTACSAGMVPAGHVVINLRTKEEAFT